MNQRYPFQDQNLQGSLIILFQVLKQQLFITFRTWKKRMYRYANTFYNLEDYYLAGYQFERFVVSYPKSDSLEMAAYKSAKSYYEL